MQYSLSDVASYISVKMNTEDISLDEYISTENMLPDKGGITRATSLPSTAKTNSFQEGDVLFSNIRTYFRKIWFATFKGGSSNDVLVIRSLNEDVLFNKYLYYLLSNEAFIQHTIKTAKGTKMPRGDKSAIMNYQFELPPLPTQKKIAHILSTLDDKIELNRKMNETLEAMAQALFKSWFVDFDPVHAKAGAKSEQELEVAASRLGISKEILDLFPSEFEESEMGMIPLRWSNKTLGSICKVQSGYAFKGSWWQDTGVKVVKIKNINGTEVDTKDCQCVSQEIAAKNAKFKLNHGDCLIAMTGATVGKVGIIDTSEEEFLLNQRVGRFQPIEHYVEYIKTLTKTDKFFDAIQSEAQGSAQPNISASGIEDIKIIKPSNTVSEAFEKILKPIYSKMLSHQSETRSLQKTRDTLLPKLLSGELDVSNINIGLENEV